MKWMIGTTFVIAIGTGVAATRHGVDGLTWPPPTAELQTAASPHVPEPGHLFASGLVEGARRDSRLQFEIEGRLLEVLIEEGDRVCKGQVLARLDASAWDSRLREAEARLEVAQAQLARLKNAASPEARLVAQAAVALAEVRFESAERDLRRADDLLARRATSQQERDDYHAVARTARAELELARARFLEADAAARADDVRIAQANVALAESAVEQAKIMIDKTRLTAPCNATVLRVDTEPGELVGPGRSALITLADTSRLLVRGYVDELDALSIRAGQRAFIMVDGRPGIRYEGVVASCVPSLGPKRLRDDRPGERLDVKVREVLIALKDRSDLIVGLPVDVYIEPGEATSAPSDSSTSSGCTAGTERGQR